MNKVSILSELKEIEMLVARKTIRDAKDNNQVPISPIQARIIAYLLKHSKERVFQRDLEKYLKLRRSTISGVLQTMEKNNIIKKMDVEEDARIKQIVFTDDALLRHRNMKKEFEKFEKVIRKNITDDDLDVFLKVTAQIKKNLQEGVD